MNRRDRICRHYEPRIQPDRAGYDILDWASAEAQDARFAVLARTLRTLPGKTRRGAVPPTLLDAGCGLAELRSYLHDNEIRVAYTGCDITPGILAEAGRRQPDANLVLADLFAGGPARFPPASFDAVFASGLFNLDLGNNDDFLGEAVPVLFDLARHVLVINLLHRRTPRKYDHCHYYDPAAVRERFACLPCRIELDESYLPNDFTVIFRKGKR